jgi:DNA-directed RNA polymerase I, II, and III subunit RPABC2
MERDLEFLKSKIPKEVYEANKEKYDAKLDELEEADINEEDEDIEDEETQASVDESIEKEEEDEDEDEDLEEQEVERLGTAFPEIEDDNEDEEDDDEFYLQKFDDTTQQKIIADFHPELQSHNYDEIDVLSRVVRDENGNIIDPLHKTIPFITRYEKARILGERAKQINAGAKTFVELEPNVIDGYVIALKEFEAKKIPFIVKRPMPNGGVEYWRFEDLEVLV